MVLKNVYLKYKFSTSIVKNPNDTHPYSGGLFPFPKKLSKDVFCSFSLACGIKFCGNHHVNVKSVLKCVKRDKNM